MLYLGVGSVEVLCISSVVYLNSLPAPTPPPPNKESNTELESGSLGSRQSLCP